MTRPSTRRLAAILISTALLFSAAACGDDDEPAAPTPGQPDKITVGVLPVVDVAPIYLGKSKGFFSNRNIDIRMQLAQGGVAIVPAVVSGQYEFGFSNVVSLMIAQQNNVPVKGVANGVNSTGATDRDFGALVVKDPSIATAKDLEGKTVASNTLKNIVDTSVKEIVRKAGGDASKVKFVELGFPEMAAALEQDRVEGIFVVEPFLSAALAKGWKTVGTFADVDPKLCVALYFTSDQLAASKPDLVQRFTAAIKESLTYADSHPEEVKAILTTYTQLKAEATAAITLPKFPAETDKTALDNLSALLVREGVLTGPADSAKLLS